MSRLHAISEPRGATLRWTLGLFLVQAVFGPLLHAVTHSHDTHREPRHGIVASPVHEHRGDPCHGHAAHSPHGPIDTPPRDTAGLDESREFDVPCPEDCDDPSHHHANSDRHPHAHSCSVCSLFGSLAPAPRALTPETAERASHASCELSVRPERAAARPGSPRAPPVFS